MRKININKVALVWTFLALAGCGYVSSTTLPSFTQRTLARQTGSLGQPSFSKQGLLYISSPTQNQVYVYSYPQGKLTTTLDGLVQPGGECVDSVGDVFIVASTNSSYTSSLIYEYAHGGTTPIATLNDPGAGYGCAIDPVTGNLAVANVSDASNPYHPYYGDVAIYLTAAGKPTMYYSPAFIDFMTCGYDNASNLYVLSTTSASPHQTALARLSNGSSSLELMSVNKPISGGYRFTPSVQWDGKHMTVSSDPAQGHGREAISIYRLRISGTNATAIGTTKLNSPRNLHGGESWIQGGKVFGIYYYKGNEFVASWKYPKGGEARPIDKVTSGIYELIGLTFSAGPN